MTDGTNQICLSKEEIQAELLAILESYTAYCTRHKLTFSLVGGTLLGAIRHHGFIPWDDDIDVGMPRPHYEALMHQSVHFEEETGLRIEGFRSLSPHDSPMLKIVNPKIQALEDGVYQTFLWIDVLPIDALPDAQDASNQQCIHASRLRRLLAFLMTPRTAQSSLTVGLLKTYAIQPIVTAIPALPRNVARHLVRIASRIPYGTTQHTGIVAWGMYGIRERVPLSGVLELSEVTFEGKQFPALSCWDLYLSNLYGTYMQLPPESHRVSHGIKAWTIEEHT